MRIKVTPVFIKNIEALLDDKRHIENVGSTRSSKTWSKVQEYVLLGLIRKNTELFMVGKTNKIIMFTLEKALKKILGKDYRRFGKYLSSKNTYFFRNGSTLTFISSENAEDYHGVESHFVDYEEPNIYKDGATLTEQLSMRCKGVSSYTLNPSRKVEFLQNLAKRKDYKYIHSTYKDNPFLNKNTIDEIEERAKHDERYRRIYVEGQYVANTETAIFTHWEVSDFYPSVEQSKKVIYGLDWGFSNDPTALVELRVYNSKLYIREIFSGVGMTTQQINDELNKLPNRSVIVADNSEPRLISELRVKQGSRIQLLKARKRKGSIKTGIKKMQSIPIVLDSRSPYLVEEFELYSWKKISGELTDTPEDKNNHRIDGARYAYEYLDSSNKLIIK